MARKAFAGDLVHALPKGRIEPYRLWFEYLKLAHTLMPNKVDRDFYQPWGAFENADFKDWWSQSWRALFAIPSSVSLISSEDEYRDAVREQDCFIVRISRNGTTTQKLADIKTMLDLQFGKARSRSQIKPIFTITAKRNVHYPALRQKLRFIKLVEDCKSIDLATKKYIEWAEAWNAKLPPKSSKRTAIPRTLARFAKELSAYESDLRSRGRAKKTREYSSARSDVLRFEKSGRKILANVASGVFPGSG